MTKTYELFGLMILVQLGITHVNFIEDLGVIEMIKKQKVIQKYFYLMNDPRKKVNLLNLLNLICRN